jgi:hypothetical protein
MRLQIVLKGRKPAKNSLKTRGKKSGFLRAQNFIFLKNAKKLKNEKKA